MPFERIVDKYSLEMIRPNAIKPGLERMTSLAEKETECFAFPWKTLGPKIDPTLEKVLSICSNDFKWITCWTLTEAWQIWYLAGAWSSIVSPSLRRNCHRRTAQANATKREGSSWPSGAELRIQVLWTVETVDRKPAVREVVRMHVYNVCTQNVRGILTHGQAMSRSPRSGASSIMDWIEAYHLAKGGAEATTGRFAGYSCRVLGKGTPNWKTDGGSCTNHFCISRCWRHGSS